MAFVSSQLERIGGGARKLFIYNGAADVVGDIDADGYFNAARDQLDKNDVIICIGNNTGTVDLLVVSSLRSAHGSASSGGAAGNVTVINAEGITAT